LRHALSQCLAVYKFRDNEMAAVIRLLYLVYGDDVGMVQSGSGAGFLLESSQPVCIARELIRKKLHSDRAIQAYIMRQVNFTHSAYA
jgi:hypothetical protein